MEKWCSKLMWQRKLTCWIKIMKKMNIFKRKVKSKIINNKSVKIGLSMNKMGCLHPLSYKTLKNKQNLKTKNNHLNNLWKYPILNALKNSSSKSWDLKDLKFKKTTKTYNLKKKTISSPLTGTEFWRIRRKLKFTNFQTMNRKM